MRYKLLGKSGLRVSELSLGAMRFHGDESRQIFDAFVEAGGNFFDTANVYGNGESERLLGEYTRSERDRYVIKTKYSLHRPGGSGPNAAGNHRKNLVRSLEESLKRLRTEYVDLLLLHAWDFLTPVEEVMRGLDDLVRSGKVLYVGISNPPAWIVSQANTLAELRGWSPFIELSIQYNLIERTPERELLPMAEAFGLGVTAWSPLAHGILAGQTKLAAGPLVTGRYTERKQAIVAVLQQLAQRLGTTPAQIALAWLRAQSPSIIPIIAGSTLAQVQDNLECLKIMLTSEDLRILDEVSRLPYGYPLDFLSVATEPIYAGFLEQLDTDRKQLMLKAMGNQL